MPPMPPFRNANPAIRNQTPPQQLFLIETDEFEVLRQRMVDERPFHQVILHIRPGGMMLKAQNAAGLGFEIECYYIRDRFNVWYRMTDGGRGGRRINEVFSERDIFVEAAQFVEYFLDILPYNDEIGTFTLGQFIEPRDTPRHVRYVRTNFFKPIHEYLEQRYSLIKVRQLIMEHNGLAAQPYGIRWFLPYMKLTGDKELVLKPCEGMLGPQKVALTRVFRLPRQRKPEKLTVEKLWTPIDSMQFAMFREISTSCAKLRVKTVQNLIKRFLRSRIFESCTIESDIIDHDVRQLYNHSYPRDGQGSWTVQVRPQFTVGIEGNTFTFRKHN